MIQVTIAGTKYNIPETCKELTIGQLLHIRTKKPDIIENLAILCKVEPDTFSKIRYSSKATKEINHAIALTNILAKDVERFFSSDERFITPKEVTIMDKTIRIPQDLEKEPFWPSRKVKEILQEQIELTGKGLEFDPTNRIAEVLAHYLYVPFTGYRYNEYRADEFKEAINELPVTQAVALANFFFLKWKRLYLGRLSSFLTNLLHLKKKLAWKYSRITETLIL